MTDLEWMHTITGSEDDELLTLLLETAEAELLNFTNRTTLPEGLTLCKRKWALIAFNRRGMEGETSRSEGGISSAFAEIPAEIHGQVVGYRLARVAGKTFEAGENNADEAVG